MMKVPKKDLFVKAVIAVVAVLFVVRLCFPSIKTTGAVGGAERAAGIVEQERGEGEQERGEGEQERGEGDPSIKTTGAVGDEGQPVGDEERAVGDEGRAVGAQLAFRAPRFDFSRRHRIRGVVSYRTAFPDVQDVQFPAAVANGVPPVANREEAEDRKRDLLFVGVNPYYEMDPAMNRSIPYLVPKASLLLQHIGRRFLDSLAVKGVPLHKIIVTSVLRTEDDVRRLKRVNGNVSEQSCHRFGTTFDISYNRYHTVCPPDDPHRRAVRSDSLKYILCEVLRDARQEGRCYVKYEVKQGCFHVTVR